MNFTFLHCILGFCYIFNLYGTVYVFCVFPILISSLHQLPIMLDRQIVVCGVTLPEETRNDDNYDNDDDDDIRLKL